MHHLENLILSQKPDVLKCEVTQDGTLLWDHFFCSGTIYTTTDQPHSENSSWGDERVSWASLNPLTEHLQWNKGAGDVVLCLFEVTTRFYSHRPAPLHHCTTTSIQNELEKKKKPYVMCCSFVLVEQTLNLNCAAANYSFFLMVCNTTVCPLDCVFNQSNNHKTAFSLLVHGG